MRTDDCKQVKEDHYSDILIFIMKSKFALIVGGNTCYSYDLVRAVFIAVIDYRSV